MKSHVLLSEIAAVLLLACALVSPTRAQVATDGIRLIAPIGHRAAINDVALSKDGKYAASCADDNSAIVWEMATGRIVRRLTLPDNGLNVRFTPDGAHLLTTAYPHKLIAWNLSDGKKQWSVNVPIDLSSLSIRPDGQAVAVAGHTAEILSKPAVRVYRIDTGVALYSFTPTATNDNDVTRIEYAPDGSRLYGYSEDAYARYRESAGAKPGAVFAFDARNGALVRAYPGAGSFAGVSADGQHLLSKLKGKALWLNTQTGTIDKAYALEPRNDRSAQTVALRADDTRFTTLFIDPDATSNYGMGQFKEYDIATGRVVNKSTLNGLGSLYYLVKYTPSGELITTLNESDYRIAQFDVATGGVSRILRGATQRIFAPSALSPNGKIVYLTNGTRTGMIGWDTTRHVTTSLSINAPDTHTREPFFTRMAPALSKDGAVLATPGVWNDTISVTDTATGNSRTTIKVRIQTLAKNIAVHPRGIWVAAPTRNSKSQDAVQLFSTKTGALLRELIPPPSTLGLSGILGIAADNSGKRVFVTDVNRRLLVFDADTGSLLREYLPHKAQNNSGIVVVQPIPGEDEHVLLTDYSGLATEFDLASGTILRTFANGESDSLLAAAVSADGAMVALGRDDGVIELWSRTDTAAKLLATMPGHSGRFQSLAFSSDGKQLTSLGGDGIVRFWNTEQHRELSALVLFTRAPSALSQFLLDEAQANREKFLADIPVWMAYDRAGFFEGDEAATKQINFADGMRTFAAEQFFERYYKPGLLTAALSGDGGSEPPVPGTADAIKRGAPPVVRIVSPNVAKATTAAIEVTVEATEQAGGGVKAIRLYHNGRLVGGPAALRGIGIEAVSGKTTTKKFTVPLTNGANDIRAVAYSNTDLESAPAETTITFQPPLIARPTLHVLAIGINAYKDASMNLAYARPDAEAIADFFGKASPLFAKVDVVRLVDEEATSAAIQKSLADMAATAKPEDVLFIYLAGHGETADGQWYFLPTEMRQMALEERVKQYGIPGTALEAAIAKIPSQKVVLVYDACKSGAAVANLRGVAEEQQALAVMARAQGIHILTASTAQQYAGEVKELGHGILTYALLEGLGGKAARATDSSVLVRELMSYVEERVPALAKQYRGIEQYPVPFERGQNFPLVGVK